MSPITKHVQKIVSFNLTLSAKKEQWKCMVLPEMESIWMLLSPLRLWTRTFLKMGIPRGLKWKEPNSYDISRFEWRNTYCSPKFNSFGSKRIGEPNTVIAPSFSSFLEWRKSKSLILIKRSLRINFFEFLCIKLKIWFILKEFFRLKIYIIWGYRIKHIFKRLIFFF